MKSVQITMEIEGINLEKLLRAAAEAGILVTHAKRSGPRKMRICLAGCTAAGAVHAIWMGASGNSGRHARARGEISEAQNAACAVIGARRAAGMAVRADDPKP